MLISTARRIVASIESLGDSLVEQSDTELKKGYLSLRYRAKSGESLDRLLPECFALVREAGRRRLAMRHFDVQLIGGMVMNDRKNGAYQCAGTMDRVSGGTASKPSRAAVQR